MGVVIMREMVMIVVLLLFLLLRCAGVGGVGAVMKE